MGQQMNLPRSLKFTSRIKAYNPKIRLPTKVIKPKKLLFLIKNLRFSHLTQTLMKIIKTKTKTLNNNQKVLKCKKTNKKRKFS